MADELPLESPARVQECATRDVNGFEHGGLAHAPAPGIHDLVNGFAAREVFKNLPDHDAGAFEGGFAVADERVGHDVFSEFKATAGGGAVARRTRFGGSRRTLGFRGRSHAANMRRCSQCSTMFSTWPCYAAAPSTILG